MPPDRSTHFTGLRACLEEASSTGVVASHPDLSGYSGTKLMGALQRIAVHQADRGAGCYLEIGVFQGLTLLSVALALKGRPAWGIDNFSQVDPRGENRGVFAARRAATGTDNAQILDMDYEDALRALDKHVREPIGLYFVDGPHDYRSQLMCLLLARPYLSDDAVIVVDDSNYLHVRQANCDFLVTHPEYKLFFEAYTRCHPANMSESEQQEARQGWWDGVNVMVRDPRNELAAELPPTKRERTLFESEHATHSLRHPALAPASTRLASNLASLRFHRLPRDVARLARDIWNSGPVGTFETANTWSDTLPGPRFNSKSSS